MYYGHYFTVSDSTSSSEKRPQMLLFSATVPEWVNETAERYMTPDRMKVDLVGRNTVRTAVNVEVCTCVYMYMCTCTFMGSYKH